MNKSDLQNPGSIGATVTRMARKGIDQRTIQYHLESVLERKLTEAESAEMIGAWRATAADRAEIYKRRAHATADEARKRRR